MRPFFFNWIGTCFTQISVLCSFWSNFNNFLKLPFLQFSVYFNWVCKLMVILTILVLLFYFYRNAVSLETHLGETEMEEWGSTQRTLMNLSHKEPITEKHDRSTQTEHLLIESLATPERQAKRLPPIQHRISTDHWWVQCAISHWRTQYWRIIFEYTCCWKYPS